ncbi:hypothetical protein V1511DRAFT_510642 [Dipodascopsis uninucleata]
MTRKFELLTGLFALLIAFASLASAAEDDKGCYSDSGSLVFVGNYTYQSSGYCITECSSKEYAVAATTSGNECYCGNSIPDSSTSSSHCNVGCFGYPEENCGGNGYFSVYITGAGTLESSDTDSSSGQSVSSQTSTATPSTSTTSSSTSSASSTITSISTTSSASSTVTSPQETDTAPKTASTVVITTGVTVVTVVSSVPVTASPSASASISTGGNEGSDSSNLNNSSKSSKGGLSGGAIGGIVVAIIVVLAIIALIVFFLLRRKRSLKDDDDDWNGYYGKKGNYSGSTPSAGGMIAGTAGRHDKLSSSSFNSGGGRVNIVDQRLNPVMMERRLSDGSVSDEQDYSRKILRVVNMD